MFTGMFDSCIKDMEADNTGSQFARLLPLASEVKDACLIN